ncbi:MAG: hypothetical protein RIS47_528, partial [Bacteroidota bacterium]
MKKLYIVLSFLFSIVLQQSFAQCTGCTNTVTAPSSSAINATSGTVFCITGTGDYTGAVTSASGSVICVASGVNFKPTSMATNAGTIIINVGATATLPAFTAGVGLKFEVYGACTFNGTVTPAANSIVSYNVHTGATAVFAQNFGLSSGGTYGSSITNEGAVTFNGSLTTGTSTNVYNYGTITVTTTFTNQASFKNYGKLIVGGDITLTNSGGDSFHNYCTVSTTGNFT